MERRRVNGADVESCSAEGGERVGNCGSGCSGWSVVRREQQTENGSGNEASEMLRRMNEMMSGPVGSEMSLY